MGWTNSASHQVYPYLLDGLEITRRKGVWCVDITFIPMAWGFAYLLAIMDVFSRRILSWRLSNSMDTCFCLEALEEALTRFGQPEICNSDQGSQFTYPAFTSLLRPTRFASAWTVKAAGRTTSSPNDSDGALSTRRSTCTPAKTSGS